MSLQSIASSSTLLTQPNMLRAAQRAAAPRPWRLLAAPRASTSHTTHPSASSSRLASSSSSSSPSSSQPPPAPSVSFPCVDANEARGARLKARAEAAKATSASAQRHAQAVVQPPRPPPPSHAPAVELPSSNPPHSPSQPPHPSSSPQAADLQQPSETQGPEPAYANIVSGYQLFHHPHDFELDYGGVLPGFDVAYETWGQLNADASNAILLHTGLSASSHAASHAANPSRGWWEDFIGPDKPLDTNRFFVVCTNVLGGCYGSTGPSSPHPHDPTGAPWATRFPLLSIFDMVRAQFLLLDHLGIGTLYASVGSSMGGMQSVAAAHLEPERVRRVVSISGCARSGPSSIALRFAQRSVLMADPNWNRGFYYGEGQLPPHTGMKLARQIATITYRSGPEWEQRFGRQRRRVPVAAPGATTSDAQAGAPGTPASAGAAAAWTPPPGEEQEPALCPDFLIETYLDHQGEQFCLKYDANSLIYISKAMDLFDMSDEALRDLERRKLARRRRQRSEADVTLHEGPSLSDDAPGRGGGETPSSSPASGAAPPAVVGGRQYIQSLSSESAHNYLSSLAKGLRRLSDKPVLVVAAHSDLLFPQEQQHELVESLKRNGNERVAFYILSSPYGHDTFLIDVQGVGGALRGFLSN